MNLGRNGTSRTFVPWLALLLAALLTQGCIYMKMDPPPDLDKGPPPPPSPAVDNTCWMATAANMLAGAGYGNGATVQVRSEDVYGDMVANYGKANGGWTDTALNWWLSSANNTWPANPYTVVTVYGNKFPNPWANATGARFIGNELRRCQFVGCSISWPTGNGGSGGHAITCWGDHSGKSQLTTNPTRLRVTDSDADTGGDVQSYRYDTYTNPNPAGSNEGNGWYFDYSNNHPFIKHIVTLCSTDNPGDQQLTQKVVGSYRIHQDSRTDATDLHYRVGTDVDILSYRTTVSWKADGPPAITESQPQRRELTVDWNFTEKPVPYCNWVTITTEFILPSWNAIKYHDVHFTYPDGVRVQLPDLAWNIETPTLEGPHTQPNISGGHVLGAFEIRRGSESVAEYRFIHEYSFEQDPETHLLTLSGTEGYTVANFRFGHSYGYVDENALWRFDDWMSEDGSEHSLGEEPAEIRIDWDDRLPYPEGEDITKAVREITDLIRD